MITRTDVRDRIASINAREAKAWIAAELFLENRDPHGLHDMGVEIECLRKARTELETLLERAVD